MIRAGSGRRDVGDRPRAPQGGLSQNVEQKKGWTGGEVKEREKSKGGRGGFKPGRVFPLEMVLPLGPATLSKSLQLCLTLQTNKIHTVVLYSCIRIVKQRHPEGK